MRETRVRTSARELMRALGIVFAGLLVGLSLNLACSSDDDLDSRERPEPTPPPSLDALGDAGDGGTTGCPAEPPKLGETCPRPVSSDEVCEYTLGTCTKENITYDRKVMFRCYDGTWHDWNPPGGSPCDTP